MVIAIVFILLSIMLIVTGLVLAFKVVLCFSKCPSPAILVFLVLDFILIFLGFTLLLSDGLPLLAQEKQIQSTLSMQAEFQTELGHLEGKPIYYSDLEKHIEYFALPEITSFDAPIQIHLYTKDEIKKDITEREDDKLIIGKIYHVRE